MIVQQSSQAQLQNPPQVEMRFLSSCHYKGEGVVLDMQYNHDGSLLAIACSNGELCIYDLVQDNKKTPLCCFKDHKGGILKLTWSLPQLGRYLASCSIDKSINVYEINVEGNTRRHCIQLNCIPVSMAFCPWDEKLVLVVGLSNGELQVYGEDFEGSSTVPDAHLMSINCVSWSNEIVVSNQRIQWVKKTLTNVEIYMPNDTLPLLATVSSDRKLHIWRIDLDSLKLFKVAETVAHEKQIRQVSWKPNLFIGKVKSLATCSQDCSVKLWDLNIDRKLSERRSIPFPGTVWRVQWNPLGSSLAVCFNNDKDHFETKLYSEDRDGKLVEVARSE